MKIELETDLPFLTGGQLLETASKLDALHARTLKTIDRLQVDVAAQKQAVADRWKTAPIAPSDKERIKTEEIRAGVMRIKQNAQAELDGLLKEAGVLYSLATSQRPYYDSPVKSLNRITLGDAKRSEYARQIADVGPGELAHLGQFAVSTKNAPLAAALVSKLDALPQSSRPYSGPGLAAAMQLEDHRKGVEAIRIAAARFQGVVLAVRTWSAGASNPIDAVSLALMNRELDERTLSEVAGDDIDQRS